MKKQPQQEERRLLAVLAHPDDESLGNGGMLARYAAEGVQTYLLTATRGEEGWFGPPEENPGPIALGRIREAELRAAGGVLGIDASDYWETAWRAIACHRSQLPGYESLLNLPESYHRRLWGNQTYVRPAGGNSYSDRVTETFFDSPGKPANLLIRPLITTLRASGRAPAVTTRKENLE